MTPNAHLSVVAEAVEVFGATMPEPMARVRDLVANTQHDPPDRLEQALREAEDQRSRMIAAGRGLLDLASWLLDERDQTLRILQTIVDRSFDPTTPFRRTPADPAVGGQAEPVDGSSGSPEPHTSGAGVREIVSRTGLPVPDERVMPETDPLAEGDWELDLPEHLRQQLHQAPSTTAELDAYFDRIVNEMWADPAARRLATAVYRDLPVGVSTNHLPRETERAIGFFAAEMRVRREKCEK